MPAIIAGLVVNNAQLSSDILALVCKARNTVDATEQARLWSDQLEGSDPRDSIRWAVETFNGRLAIGSSFGRDGLVVLDLARRIESRIPVLFLETGYHFRETLSFRDDLVSRWGLNVIDVRPDLSVPEQDAQFGPALHGRDPDLCCRMRKVVPLQRALEGYSAWITGLRRDQHPSRGETPVVEWQELGDGHGVFKVNPMVSWSRPEVNDYLSTHEIPSHPLWAQGYPSVGCAPCTSPVAAGAPERSGRWAATGKVECGIHTVGVRRGPLAETR